MTFLGAVAAIFALSPGSGSPSMNGFDLTDAIVPVDQLAAGGPERDGIPALTNPKHLAAVDADYLTAEDLVIGIRQGDVTRAYPLRILVWHENINDTLGDASIAVTYCPLCNSALVFDRNVGGTVREFGVSGLLYNSNVLLYDRGDKPSLWSQYQRRAITGPAAQQGHSLKLLPSELTSWSDWKARHPQTTVISPDTGYRRDYRTNPYAGYFRRSKIIFPVIGRKSLGRFHNKDQFLLLNLGGQFRAYPIKLISERRGPDGRVVDIFDEYRVVLTYSRDSKTARAEVFQNESKISVPTAYMFYFALSLFSEPISIYSRRTDKRFMNI